MSIRAQRRFTCPVLPQQGMHFAPTEVEVDILEYDLSEELLRDTDVTLAQSFIGERRRAAEELLELRSVSASRKGATRLALDSVEVTVNKGQIVGVAGVAGNGQRELAEVITGLRPIAEGRIRFQGEDISNRPVAERTKLGIGFVPEDRLTRGLALGLELDDNVLLRSQRDQRFRRGPFLRLSTIKSWARQLVDRFSIRGVRRGLPIGVLSGGNLQRLILARELSRQPSLLVASGPTRGLDVGAAETVRRMLRDQRDRGVGILLVSGDLEEILEISDDVLVMYEGRVVASRKAAEVDLEEVGRLMTGVL